MCTAGFRQAKSTGLPSLADHDTGSVPSQEELWWQTLECLGHRLRFQAVGMAPVRESLLALRTWLVLPPPRAVCTARHPLGAPKSSLPQGTPRSPRGSSLPPQLQHQPWPKGAPSSSSSFAASLSQSSWGNPSHSRRSTFTSQGLLMLPKDPLRPRSKTPRPAGPPGTNEHRTSLGLVLLAHAGLERGGRTA